ncbi:hypothetical protein [Amycolatopsis sp. NPDC051071]|uniref:hypothetical protein n=1 Tax=Amycolatopsis sp. NPDC051071 TaxID=3154637 RepID=UPI0034315BA5
MLPAQPSDAAAEELFLGYFAQEFRAELAKRGAHPAVRLVRTRNGPGLQAFVAANLAPRTALRVIKQTYFQNVGGDAMKSLDRWHPAAAPTHQGTLGSGEGAPKLDFYYSDQPKSCAGTFPEIMAWFDENSHKVFVVRDEEVGDNDVRVDFTVEVRPVSVRREGGKDFVDAGGLRAGTLAAFKAMVLGAAGSLSGGDAFSTVGDAMQATADVVEQAPGFLPKPDAGGGPAIPFDRDFARTLLTFEVEMREGHGSGDGRTVHHDWTDLRPDELKTRSGDKKTTGHLFGVVSVEEIRAVVPGLVEKVLDRIQQA